MAPGQLSPQRGDNCGIRKRLRKPQHMMERLFAEPAPVEEEDGARVVPPFAVLSVEASPGAAPLVPALVFAAAELAPDLAPLSSPLLVEEAFAASNSFLVAIGRRKAAGNRTSS